MCVCNRTTRSSSNVGRHRQQPSAASRLGVLSADGDTPCVAETTVVAHLLQSLEVIPPRSWTITTVDLLVLAIMKSFAHLKTTWGS